jgi:hypothetical protein
MMHNLTDTERLDWIGTHLVSIRENLDSTIKIFYLAYNDVTITTKGHSSFREALDAAIEGWDISRKTYLKLG